MLVLIASAEDESYDFRAHVYDIGYEKEKRNFYISAP